MVVAKGDCSSTAALCGWRCGKLTRVSHSSFDGETIESVDALDSAAGVSLFLDEAFRGPRPTLLERREALLEGVDLLEGRPEYSVQVEVHTDAKCLTTRVEALTLDQGMRKSRKTDIADLRDALERGLVESLRHIAGVWNPADALTKLGSRTKQTMQRLDEVVRGVYVPFFG